ncbi:MAG: diaminopimelate decarboxylase [Dehalococcoidia bacterium]|nr:diaminopimelate decarboxylase [Dehalococcoidia bacterium]
MSPLEDFSTLLPETAAANEKGHLVLGGCDAASLASEFGTPLYVFDEVTLRNSCSEYLTAFRQNYPDSRVIYAAKAFINRALAAVINEEGLGLDVASAGELTVAQSVGFPMEKVCFHGNNKQREELELAVSLGVGRIAVDSMYELDLLNEISMIARLRQKILLRLTPGIDAHTHKHITTGVVDSKFGIPMVSGAAEDCVARAIAAPGTELVGLHVHLGSLIFEAEPYTEAVSVVFEFAARMKKEYGLDFREFSPGGGFAVQYTRDAPSPSAAYYAEAISGAIASNCGEYGLHAPCLVVEPGRAIVARAGVALYRAGSVKIVPGVRKYVSVDGGMADNIRPALYGSRYEALIANKMNEEASERVTIVGRFCESGDVLVRDVDLPAVTAGDLVAVPVTGAYCIPMASNYNASLKPAVVMVKDGHPRLIRKRETYQDLMRNDVLVETERP